MFAPSARIRNPSLSRRSSQLVFFCVTSEQRQSRTPTFEHHKYQEAVVFAYVEDVTCCAGALFASGAALTDAHI